MSLPTGYTTWTDGYAVGFRYDNPATGETRYVYLNPSAHDAALDGPNVFLYEGHAGVPLLDSAVVHVPLADPPVDLYAYACGHLVPAGITRPAFCLQCVANHDGVWGVSVTEVTR